jgi:hypothetical protein
MSDIDQMRQNHPELVVRDILSLAYNSHSSDDFWETETRAVLKRRGVNKWLAVRRLLIQTKARWKKQLTYLYRTLSFYRDCKDKEWLRGYVRCLEDCRAQVRALCHSTRDVDFPTDPNKWPAAASLPVKFPTRPKKKELR